MPITFTKKISFNDLTILFISHKNIIFDNFSWSKKDNLILWTKNRVLTPFYLFEMMTVKGDPTPVSVSITEICQENRCIGHILSYTWELLVVTSRGKAGIQMNGNDCWKVNKKLQNGKYPVYIFSSAL